MTGTEKIQEALAKETSPQNIKLLEHMKEKCEGSADYNRQAALDCKHMKELTRYILWQAAKLNTRHETMMAIDDTQVYAWADEFIMLDENETSKSIQDANRYLGNLRLTQPAVTEKPQKTERKTKKAAKKGHKTSEPAKKTSASEDTENAAKPAESAAKTQQAKPKKEKPKKNDQADGQMSIFDLLGGE